MRAIFLRLGILSLSLIAIGFSLGTVATIAAASPAMVTQSGPLKGIEGATTDRYRPVHAGRALSCF